MRIWLKNRHENIQAVTCLCFVITVLILLLCGCDKKPSKVWGEGELPVDWMFYFGDDNTARLDYVQTQRINKQGQALAELREMVRKLGERKDPNE